MEKVIKKLYMKDCEHYFMGLFINNRPTYSGKIFITNNIKGEEVILFNPRNSSVSFEIEDLQKIIKIMEREKRETLNK